MAIRASLQRIIEDLPQDADAVFRTQAMGSAKRPFLTGCLTVRRAAHGGAIKQRTISVDGLTAEAVQRIRKLCEERDAQRACDAARVAELRAMLAKTA